LDIQDMGHNFELHMVNKYYDEYYPNQNIIINMKYINDNYPYELSIEINQIHPHKLLTKEVYIKTLYNNIYNNNISCHKIDFESNKEYNKMQTFENKSEWI
jgi:hypothetical protein